MKIRFHSFELDDRLYELTRDGEPIALRPKVFDLLVHLARNRTRVVHRAELVEAVWGTTAVGAGSLSGIVNELRQALGESGRGESSIRTVHARGYQFVARVEEANDWREAAPMRSIFERVSEEGARGLIVEGASGAGCPDGGACHCSGGQGGEHSEGAPVFDALVAAAEEAGFETIDLMAPLEAHATSAGFCSELIRVAVRSRGREAVSRALPFPARTWFGDQSFTPVAGGFSTARNGPPGGVSAVASMFEDLASRRPILLVVREAEGAGERYASDLTTLLSRLGQAPVLVAVEAMSATGAWGRSLTRSGVFEAFPERARLGEDGDPDPHRAGIDALPAWLEAALLDHLGGNEAKGVTLADALATARIRQSGESRRMRSVPPPAQDRTERLGS